MKDNQKEFKRKITILTNQNEELKLRQDFLNGINIENIDSLEEFTVNPRYKYKDEAIAISALSDTHVEEPVKKSVVSGLNEYNLEIAKRRLEFYFKRLLFMVNQSRKAGYTIDTLVLAFLGDFITGYIHEELEEINSLTPAEASLFVEELLIVGLKFLSENGRFTKIIVPCTPGNHGRTTKRKRFTTGYKNSYEWIMYNNIQKLIKESGKYENIELIIPESEFIYLNLFGYVNKFSHGDHFKYQGGIGGIEIPLKKWLLRENAVIKTDMSWIAHWHQYIVLNKVRVNGALIGYNSYARAFGFEPEPPKMQFQLLDKKRGFTLNNPIILTDW